MRGPELTQKRDFYELLELQPGASATEIKTAYRRKARAHHPDVAGAGDAAMRALNQAWATLGDPARRRAYDRALGLGSQPPPPTRPCNCGLAPRFTASESTDDETLPVFESATIVAFALFGSSTRISPDPVCVNTAAGKPRMTTDPAAVTIATCARAGTRK